MAPILRRAPLGGESKWAFLVSPLAGFINGANLRIDGGFVTSVN
jgi:hypothetical protein